jgi:hypothetical protein
MDTPPIQYANKSGGDSGAKGTRTDPVRAFAVRVQG